VANISWPDSICVKSFSLELVVDLRSMTVPFGGSDQVVDLQDDFWRIQATIDIKAGIAAGQVESMVNYLAGGLNTVSLGHFARPNIRGTLSGSPTVENPIANGDSDFIIETTPGATILAGDMLGIDGLLLQCAEDAVAPGSGLLVVQLVNCFRRSIAAAQPVTLVHPKAKFRLINAPSMTYEKSASTQVSLSFEEVTNA
jgi:hypothetical protein